MIDIKRDSEKGTFRLSLNEGINVINIFSIDGSLVFEKTSSRDQDVLEFELAKGLYIMRIFDILTKKMHIEKITSP